MFTNRIWSSVQVAPTASAAGTASFVCVMLPAAMRHAAITRAALIRRTAASCHHITFNALQPVQTYCIAQNACSPVHASPAGQWRPHRAPLPANRSAQCQPARSFSTWRACIAATAAAAAAWDDVWDDFVHELYEKGYAGTAEQSEDWGAIKRAVLTFARSNDLLQLIDATSIAALAETDVKYLDRKVKNARQRLALLSGGGPKDVGTGEPSFQDVLRLLMAIQLAGDGRTPDNEAAGTSVLRQVLECARSRPAAQPAQDRQPCSRHGAIFSCSSTARRGRAPAQQQAGSWRAAPWSKPR